MKIEVITPMSEGTTINIKTPITSKGNFTLVGADGSTYEFDEDGKYLGPVE